MFDFVIAFLLFKLTQTIECVEVNGMRSKLFCRRIKLDTMQLQSITKEEIARFLIILPVAVRQFLLLSAASQQIKVVTSCVVIKKLERRMNEPHRARYVQKKKM